MERGRAGTTSDDVARMTSPVAAARNANTANVVNMTSPVNKPNLTNTINKCRTICAFLCSTGHGRGAIVAL